MKHNRHLDQIKISSHSYKKYFKFIHRISKLFKLQDFGFNVRTLILYNIKLEQLQRLSKSIGNISKILK